MKTLTIGILLVVGFVSLAGCHWRHRHRHWRGYHDRSYNSYYSGDRYAGVAQVTRADREAS